MQARASSASLSVGEPGDRFEREADSVADRVVQRMEAGRISRAAAPSVQAACAACAQKEEKLQRQAAPGEDEMLQAKGVEGPAGVSTSVEQNLRAGHAGHSLAPALQARMEEAFQADFSSVRVHTDGAAERSSQELHARAFTHGNDIYFNAGEFNPESRAGQHLLAHELTHVVQQSQTAGGVPSMQRDAKPGSPADKLEAAKKALLAKYGLQEISELKKVSEQSGVAWTEGRLRQLDALLSKMTTSEQERLRGVAIMLTDKLPPRTIRGKTVELSGLTRGTSQVELTLAGLDRAVLHEGGHLIHHNAIANAEKLFELSKAKSDLEAARAALVQSSKRRYAFSTDVGEQLNEVIRAASAFELSSDAARKANRDALEAAELLLPIMKPDPATQDLSAHLDKVRAFVAALYQWSDEKEKAVGPVKNLHEFVNIVKKDKLARRSVIFTPYVEMNWPDHPEEFFAEAYKGWRMNPAAVKALSKDLVTWFEKGGHLGPNPRPTPIR